MKGKMFVGLLLALSVFLFPAGALLQAQEQEEEIIETELQDDQQADLADPANSVTAAGDYIIYNDGEGYYWIASIGGGSRKYIQTPSNFWTFVPTARLILLITKTKVKITPSEYRYNTTIDSTDILCDNKKTLATFSDINRYTKLIYVSYDALSKRLIVQNDGIYYSISTSTGNMVQLSPANAIFKAIVGRYFVYQKNIGQGYTLCYSLVAGPYKEKQVTTSPNPIFLQFVDQGSSSKYVLYFYYDPNNGGSLACADLNQASPQRDSFVSDLSTPSDFLGVATFAATNPKGTVAIFQKEFKFWLYPLTYTGPVKLISDIEKYSSYIASYESNNGTSQRYLFQKELIDTIDAKDPVLSCVTGAGAIIKYKAPPLAGESYMKVLGLMPVQLANNKTTQYLISGGSSHFLPHPIFTLAASDVNRSDTDSNQIIIVASEEKEALYEMTISKEANRIIARNGENRFFCFRPDKKGNIELGRDYPKNEHRYLGSTSAYHIFAVKLNPERTPQQGQWSVFTQKIDQEDCTKVGVYLTEEQLKQLWWY